MPGRTPRNAVKAYAQPIRAALSCVIEKPSFSYESVVVDQVHTLALTGAPVQLRRESRRERRSGTPLVLHDLYLVVLQDYRILKVASRDYRVTTDSWTYQILDHEGQEVLAYHWHPTRAPSAPHLHVGPALLNPEKHHLGKVFSGLHLPTDRISMEQIVRLLIEDFEVVVLKVNRTP